MLPPCSVRPHPDRLPGYKGRLKAGAMSFDPALQGSYGVREGQFEPSGGKGPARKEWAGTIGIGDAK